MRDCDQRLDYIDNYIIIDYSGPNLHCTFVLSLALCHWLLSLGLIGFC